MSLTTNGEQSFCLRLPPLTGGLDLSVPPEAMEADRLSDGENLWWERGKLRTRPGLFTDNSRKKFLCVPLPEGQFVYGGVVAADAAEDKNGNPLLWEQYTISGTDYLHPFYMDEDGKEVVFTDEDGRYMQDFSQKSALATNDETGHPLFFTDNGIFTVGGESINGRWMDVEDFCHVPTMLVGGRGTVVKQSGDATGRAFEAKNRLTPRFRAEYTTDGSGIYFHLPLKNLDEEDVTARFTDGAGTTHVYTVYYDETVSTYQNGMRLAVDRVAGCVWFENTSGNPFALPANIRGGNLTVEAQKTDAASRRMVLGMRLACWFGGDSGGAEGGTRLFLAGNPDYPHSLCWSDTNNAFYFPESNFAYIGDAKQPITALARQEDMLVIFKAREMYAATYTATAVNEGDFLNGELGTVTAVTAALPITPLSGEIGCDCPASIRLCHNRLVWAHSQAGVFTLLSQNPYSTRNIRPLSAPIDAGLKSLPASAWKNASAATLDGWYLLLTGDTVWTLRYDDTAFVRFGATDRKAQQALCWYRWDITMKNITWQRLIAGKRPVFCGLYNQDGAHMRVHFILDGTQDVVPTGSAFTNTAVAFHAVTATLDMGDAGRFKDITGLWVEGDCDSGVSLSLLDDEGSAWYCLQQKVQKGVRLLPSLRRVRRVKLSLTGRGTAAWGSMEISGCKKGWVR